MEEKYIQMDIIAYENAFKKVCELYKIANLPIDVLEHLCRGKRIEKYAIEAGLIPPNQLHDQ
jgi:hypothetical protein